MAENLYRFVNEGIIPDCKGFILDGTAVLNNVAAFAPNGLIAFNNNTTVAFASNLVAFDGNFVEYTSNTDVAFFSNLVGFEGNVYFDAITEFNDIGNINIYGGNNGQVLTTYGNGTLYWGNSTGTANLTYDGFGYAVSNPGANTVTLPVYANSTSTRNIPLKYVGNTISDPWPYANGSVVANAIPPGYNINSTAAFTPATSQALFIPTSTTSYDGWFKLVEANMSYANWANVPPIISTTLSMECYSNANSTIIQIVPFLNTTADNNDQLQTSQLVTFIIDNFPNSRRVEFNQYDTFDPTIEKAGFYIRNITANTEVTVYLCTVDFLQIE